MKLKTFYNQQFIYLNSSNNKRVYILSSTFFVLIFLILFQPYGISEELFSPINTKKNIALFFLSVGICVFLSLSFSQFVLRRLLNFENVSNIKYALYFLIEIFFLILIRFCFSFFTPNLGDDFVDELNIYFQIIMFFKALIIILFPFLGTIIYVLIENLSSEIKVLQSKIHQFQTVYKSSKNDKLLICDENNNLELKLDLKNFLFAESSNQYVLIHYLENEVKKKHIVRTRLKTIIENFKKFPIEQCHRSFAINLLSVKTFIKKEGKTFLIMGNSNELIIPVSKSFLDNIKNRMLNA